jgi:two-component system phosphate regulon response regulator PhoB
MDKPKVVIVDDDEDMLEELRETMDMNGYDVETVREAAVAVQVIERSRPDVVLLDLRMQRKGGVEIADELSRNPDTSGIPVVVMTAVCSTEELERLNGLGVVAGIVTKPFAISEIVTKVEEVRRLR